MSAPQKAPESFAVLYETVLDTIARIQIDQMAIDVRRGLRAHLVGGFAPPGTAPTGYIAERVQWGAKRDGSPRYARKKEIVRLKRAIDRLLDMIETGDNSREVRERLRQRQAELGSAEMEREALAQHHLVTTIKLGDADLRRVLKTMRDELQAPEVPVARRALQSFVERIEVNVDDVEIVYRPGVVLAASTGDKFMPPRGFELIPCTRWRGCWRAGGV